MLGPELAASSWAEGELLGPGVRRLGDGDFSGCQLLELGSSP